MSATGPGTAGTKRRAPADDDEWRGGRAALVAGSASTHTHAHTHTHGGGAHASGHAGASGHGHGPPSHLETLELKPLGAGNEVGRSCHVLRFKGKTIMLDCGVLPSFTGIAALPLLDEIDPADIDIVIITHFHLDHCAALPHFTERKTGFRGRIFATHPTIAVMKMLWQDYIRVTDLEASTAALSLGGSARSGGDVLYTQDDINRCISRIEPLDFRQRVDVDGVRITFYNAGHVLGAAMALIDIASVRILYTGDYFFEADRHLNGAEIPPGVTPDVLIMESTHGTLRLDPREEREKRFTMAVERIVKRGGKCLIPVFALGITQELLLILEEFWASRPDLQHIPIMFASKLAAMSLDVYKTYVSHMNARMQDAMRGRNPWDFRFIRRVRESDDAVDAPGPAVILAAPGMLQNGFSRRLFDKWCENAVNGVVLAGYSTEGTLARRLESNPVEVESLSNRRLARHITIDRLQFSAHADKDQTANFVDALKPARIILVHGERTEMLRLHRELSRKYDAEGVQVFMPPNGSSVSLTYREQYLVQVLGSIAEKRLRAGIKLSGVLVQRNFQHMLIAPVDLPKFTEVSSHTLLQKQHVPYRSSFAMLKGFVSAMFGDVVEKQMTGEATPSVLLVDKHVRVTHRPPDRIVLEWKASPAADLIADTLVAVATQADVSHAAVAASARAHRHRHGEHGHHHEGERAADAMEEESTIKQEPGTQTTPHGAAPSAPTVPPAHSAAVAARLPDTAAAVAWALNTEWGRRLLVTDSSPLSLSDAAAALIANPPENCSIESRYYSEYMSADKAAAMLLPPPVLRRRDMLMQLLLEQYGEDCVAYRGPDAGAIYAKHAFMPTFAAVLPTIARRDSASESEGDRASESGLDATRADSFDIGVRYSGALAHIAYTPDGGFVLDILEPPGAINDTDERTLAMSSINGEDAEDDVETALAELPEVSEVSIREDTEDETAEPDADESLVLAARLAAVRATRQGRRAARVRAFVRGLQVIMAHVHAAFAPLDARTHVRTHISGMPPMPGHEGGLPALVAV